MTKDAAHSATGCNLRTWIIQAADIVGRALLCTCTAAFCFYAGIRFPMLFLGSRTRPQQRALPACCTYISGHKALCCDMCHIWGSLFGFLVSCFAANLLHPDKAAITLFKNSNSLNAGIEHAMGCSASQKACKKENSSENSHPFCDFFP